MKCQIDLFAGTCDKEAVYGPVCAEHSGDMYGGPTYREDDE